MKSFLLKPLNQVENVHGVSHAFLSASKKSRCPQGNHFYPSIALVEVINKENCFFSLSFLETWQMFCFYKQFAEIYTGIRDKTARHIKRDKPETKCFLDLISFDFHLAYYILRKLKNNI